MHIIYVQVSLDWDLGKHNCCYNRFPLNFSQLNTSDTTLFSYSCSCDQKYFCHKEYCIDELGSQCWIGRPLIIYSYSPWNYSAPLQIHFLFFLFFKKELFQDNITYSIAVQLSSTRDHPIPMTSLTTLFSVLSWIIWEREIYNGVHPYPHLYTLIS